MDELGYDLSPADVEARIEIYLRSSDSVLVADDCGEIVGFVSFHLIPLFFFFLGESLPCAFVRIGSEKALVAHC